MYVAIWFYIATALTVAVLHIVNSMAVPAGLFKSYSIYAGVQDALVQWWYGHNAVAFFLTTPYLGLMYYFLPKAANRPVFSYRLRSFIFGRLIFIYIWAGPHHLLYTALPDWAQSLGMVFSVMLVAPSWGGMLNGLLTLRGAWDKVRQDPMLKFMVVAVTAYGMATLEGPVLAIKRSMPFALHGLDHCPCAHRALGLERIPHLQRALLAVPAALQHEALVRFGWPTTISGSGIGHDVLRVPMYTSGVTQGLMWKQFTAEGSSNIRTSWKPCSSCCPCTYCAPSAAAFISPAPFSWHQPLSHRQERPVRARTEEAKPRRLVGDARRGCASVAAPVARIQAGALHRSNGGAMGVGGLVEVDPHVSDQDQRAHHLQRQTLHTARGARP
jgi:hypothetical protein